MNLRTTRRNLLGAGLATAASVTRASAVTQPDDLRSDRANKMRLEAAKSQLTITTPSQASNGDENAILRHAANFTKGLPTTLTMANCWIGLNAGF